MPRSRGITLTAAVRKKLRVAIKSHPQTLRELARKCGLQTGEALNNILNGSSRPSVRSLESLAKLVGLTCDINVVLKSKQGDNPDD